MIFASVNMGKAEETCSHLLVTLKLEPQSEEIKFSKNRDRSAWKPKL